MKRYIDCRNPEYDKIRVTFWRTRWDGMTLYKGSVTRASRNAEDSARVELVWFVNRALDLLAGIGFETVLCGQDLSNAVIDIVRSIECEVH